MICYISGVSKSGRKKKTSMELCVCVCVFVCVWFSVYIHTEQLLVRSLAWFYNVHTFFVDRQNSILDPHILFCLLYRAMNLFADFSLRGFSSPGLESWLGESGKRHKLFRYAKFKKAKLGGGNSNMFYFHPEPWGSEPVWLIFFKGVETTK